MTLAAIQGLGFATPGDVLSNADIIERFGIDVTPDWIEARTGIRSRHWLEEGRTTSDLAVEAAERALREAGVDVKSLDRIIVATISPDRPSPSTATTVARKLGARCAAFDVSAACAGFLYGLDLAAGALATGAETVLVIAVDVRSRFIDRSDRRSVVLFADGAAAAVLGRERPGIASLETVALGAEGRDPAGAWIPAGGAEQRITPEVLAAGDHFLKVDPSRDIFDHFVRFTREACDNVLRRSDCTWADVDYFITHQGNARMVELTIDALGIDPKRAANNVAEHGNTASATVPIALCEARAAQDVRDGDLVLLTSVGAGYTFGAALVRWGPCA